MNTNGTTQPINEVTPPQPGLRAFKIIKKGSDVHAHVRIPKQPDKLPCRVERRDDHFLLLVDCRDWQPETLYELHWEQVDQDDRCVEQGYCPIAMPLAEPRSAEGPAGVVGPTKPTTSTDVKINIAPAAPMPGQPVVLEAIDCVGADPLDDHQLFFTAHFEGDDHCCRDAEIVCRTINNRRTYSVLWPSAKSGPGTLHVFARDKTGTLLGQRGFPITASSGNGVGSFDLQEGTRSLPAVPQAAISLTRPARPPTPNQDFYTLIRASSNAMSFNSYEHFMELVFCGQGTKDREGKLAGAVAQAQASKLALPFPGVDAYRTLKAATEVFLLLNSGAINGATVGGVPLTLFYPGAPTRAEEAARMGHALTGTLQDRVRNYLTEASGGALTLPYLDIIRGRLSGTDVVKTNGGGLIDCEGILESKLTNPLLIELIWSYWMEEAMLAQTMIAISQRFQNRHPGGRRDPLAQLEIDPLRPFSGFLWGYVQDEQNRLGVFRRAHEYDHAYGMALQGKAVRDLRSSDRRSKFLEAFHHLLYQCVQFFRQDDDTTVIADGFGVLNALKETHYVLAQGAHNQFGDMPATARQEMLIEQWMLSRPEVREFLGGRVMVPYPEPWMDRVDTMKTLKGWTDVSVVHFRDLAVFGEQILLSVRWDAWSQRNDPDTAANWARYWRPEIQGYVHAYRAATGIDLTADVVDQTQLTERFLPPSVHLTRRLVAQAQGRS